MYTEKYLIPTQHQFWNKIQKNIVIYLHYVYINYHYLDIILSDNRVFCVLSSIIAFNRAILS